jgi:hypothetical protein
MPSPSVPPLATSYVVGQRLDDPPWISHAARSSTTPQTPEVTPREEDWGGGISTMHTVGHSPRGTNAAGMLARGQVMRASHSGTANTFRAKDRLDSLVGTANTPRAKEKLDSLLARRFGGF